MNWNFKTVFSYFFSFLPYFQTSSSTGKTPTVMEYGPEYILNMQIILLEIPLGATNAILYYTYGDGSKSQHLETKNNTKNSKIFKLSRKISDLWSNMEQEKDFKLFVDINYHNNTFCSTVFITKFVYDYSLTYLNGSPLNPCFNTSTSGCITNHLMKEKCRNSTDNIIESPMNSEGITPESPRISYELNNKRECQVAESTYIRDLIKDKHITADAGQICYKTNDVVTFTCNTTEDSNIQWLQSFGNNDNNTYCMENKAVNNIVNSILTLKLSKLDHLSTLRCKAINKMQTPDRVTETKAFALINIDESTLDKPNGGSIEVDDASVEISHLQSQEPFNHTCSSAVHDNILAVQYNGTTALVHNNIKTLPMYDNLEAYCIRYEFSILPSLIQYATNFTRIIVNRKKYAKQQHIRDNSAKWPLIIGIPAAIITGAAVCSLVWYIIQLVKRWRQSRHGNNGPDLVTYSTANEVQYAQLSMLQESSGIIRGQKEMTAYAEIIGVLEPNANK
ncbi:hypothetical protein K1T71_000857 [Dendrolimus kikuchii]|uniref:Uncharacterized protein n=1 Tax=Dendrolimus kikuchii TaxID=765133 RepID=A0ACC1DHL7_9NEOP|nr:hypothetical protein K1T71_000857 [Dendrolimus kikuchii]